MTAHEIHRRFWKKMEPGGDIDRMFKGATVNKRPPANDEAIALARGQIDTQLAEYETAVNDAVAWYLGWKRRQASRGFRCMENKAS